MTYIVHQTGEQCADDCRIALEFQLPPLIPFRLVDDFYRKQTSLFINFLERLDDS